MFLFCIFDEPTFGGYCAGLVSFKPHSTLTWRARPDNIAEAGRLRLPGGTYGSLRQSIATAHSEAGRRRLCQIKNAHATAWWREADAGWLPACRCRPGAGSTGCAGLNAAHGLNAAGPLPAVPTSTATEMTEPSTAASTRSRLTSQLELQTPVCLNGEKWRAALSLALDIARGYVQSYAFSGFPTNFGSLSHQIQLSPSCREPSLTCTAQLTGIGGSSFLSRKCASSSVFIFVYTIHRWVKSKHCTRSCGFMILKCWLALSSGGSTGHPQPSSMLSRRWWW